MRLLCFRADTIFRIFPFNLIHLLRVVESNTNLSLSVSVGFSDIRLILQFAWGHHYTLLGIADGNQITNDFIEDLSHQDDIGCIPFIDEIGRKKNRRRSRIEM